ncbi:MAG TPA: hypothetical protein VMV29_08170 [Ktedonobacterales bacterium]|nr:hypothetical protein [Ktedonobacterales bacterium]
MTTEQFDESGAQSADALASADSSDTLAATLGRANGGQGDSGDLDDDGDEGDDLAGPKPLARVRYGLGKELQLFDDTFVVVSHEESSELRLTLDNIQRLILAPGDPNPSKLILMFDLDDGSTIIAAEGMTNVRDFRALLARLTELRPQIELDPPTMDEQLAQALEIRRRSNIGCYSVVIGAILLLWVIYLVVAYIGAHTTHIVH